jgi:hypothetical protein
MTNPIDLSALTPVERMAGEDEAETAMLRDMLERAEAYLSSHQWCPPIVERYLGVGIGNVFALFLFKLVRAVNDTDEWLWVVDGDLPSAYFVIDEASNIASAVKVYCELMDEWADAVEGGASLDDVFPVKAPATLEHAKMLRNRTKFIRERIIPMI